jgi:hypothetical protein
MAIVNFSGSYGSHLKFEVLAGTVSQSVTGNSSVVRLWCNLITDSYASLYNIGAPLTIYVNGSSGIAQTNININTNSKITLWQEEYTIAHNGDGSKTVNLGLKLDINQSGYGSAEYRWDYTLTKIPRASSISASAGVLGSAMTLNIDRKDSSFTHTVRYNWQGTTGTVGTGIGTSTSYTPPLTFANNIPNTTNGTITFYCDTYSGSSLIGTNQTAVNLTIPNSVIPTIGGLTLEETATVMQGISTATEFAQILSRVKATVTGASGVYGSTINTYSISVVNQGLTVSTNGGVFDFFKNSGTFTVRAVVTDSRGRTSANKDVSITVKEYFSPTGAFTVVRSGANKDKLTVTRNAKVAPLNIGGVNKNKLTIQFKYALHNSTTWNNSTGNANENLTSTFELVNSQASLVETFLTTKSYDLIMVVSDKFLTSEIKVSIGTVVIPYAVTKDGFGIGKAPELVSAVDSAYPYYYDGNQIQHFKLTENNGSVISDYYSDLNNHTTTGFYQKANTAPNLPTGAQWGMLRVVGTGSGQVSQIYHERNGQMRTFTRAKTDNVWKEWKELIYNGSNATFGTVLQTSKFNTTISGPYSTTLSAVRVGNLVMINLNRNIYTIAAHEYALMNNTIPSGFRPSIESVLRMQANSSTVGVGSSSLHFGSDGSIRLTNGITNANVWTGTVTFITTDPFPS